MYLNLKILHVSNNMYLELDKQIIAIISQMGAIIDSLNTINFQDKYLKRN